MPRLFTLSVAVALAGLVPAAARAADEPKDLLEKAIKAHGGEEFLTKNKGTYLKSKGKLDLPGVGETDFTQDTAVMLPDKLRDTLELKVAGQTITIFTLVNGDKVTLEVNGKDTDAGDKVKDAMQGVAHLAEVGRLVPLRDKKYELSIIGEDKVEGKKVVGVRVTAKDKTDVSLYFDKETGLIAKLEHRTSDPATGKEITEERIVVEYTKNKAGSAGAQEAPHQARRQAVHRGRDHGNHATWRRSTTPSSRSKCRRNANGREEPRPRRSRSTFPAHSFSAGAGSAFLGGTDFTCQPFIGTN